MKHETTIYLIIGSAVVGIAYYLWKQEQAPPAQTSSIFSTITNTAGNALSGTASAGLTAFENLGAFF